jgi:peptidoglycan/LPS O-acetylase OafA/YrhL
MRRTPQRRRWCEAAILSTLAILALVGAMLAPQPISDGLLMKTVGFIVAPAAFAMLVPSLSRLDATRCPSILSRLITFVSLTSYSVYLVHWEFFRATLKTMREQVSYEARTLSLALTLVATYSVAWDLYRLVEKPTIAWRDRHFRDMRPASVYYGREPPPVIRPLVQQSP